MTELHQICLCILSVAMAQSSSVGVAVCHIVPVLWMTSNTSYFLTIDPAALSCVANIPALWYWLHPVLDDRGCQEYYRRVLLARSAGAE